MKAIFLMLILIFPVWHAYSQSLYGTALIDGSIVLQIEETYEEYCNGILSIKKEIREQYSS